MTSNNAPNDKLKTLKDSSEDLPEIIAIANFENQFCLSRRDFLSETAKIAILIGLSASVLQTGCAAILTNSTSKQLKIKVPQLIALKEDTLLRKEPNGHIIKAMKKDQQVEVLEEKGDWLKIRTKDNIIGWISKNDVIFAEYTERTLPCGSPLPVGAICLCNCIPTYTCGCDPHTYYHRYCTCVPVCTCDLIPVS